MIDKILDLYARLFARPQLESINKFFLQAGLQGLGVRNFGSEYLSGEMRYAVRTLKNLDRDGAIVVDVGANEGRFVECVLDCSRHLRVVAIEPHPKTFERLARKFNGNCRVTLVNCAVGNERGMLELYDHAEASGTEQASAYREAISSQGANATSVTVVVKLLDDILMDVQEDVCFLKIDVEGFEWNVLRGASETVRRQNLKIILAEFNEMNVCSRTFLQDLRRELSEFDVCRVLPGGRLLKLRNYGAWKEELFAYQNLAFIRQPVG